MQCVFIILTSAFPSLCTAAIIPLLIITPHLFTADLVIVFLLRFFHKATLSLLLIVTWETKYFCVSAATSESDDSTSIFSAL